jgi:hypothetical protein
MGAGLAAINPLFAIIFGAASAMTIVEAMRRSR